MRHGLDRGRVVRRWRRGGEAFGKRRMMGLTAQRDQRFDPRRRAGIDVSRAEIAGVGQQSIGLPKCLRQCRKSDSIGSTCCLSLGACTTSAATTSRLPAATTACAL